MNSAYQEVTWSKSYLNDILAFFLIIFPFNFEFFSLTQNFLDKNQNVQQNSGFYHSHIFSSFKLNRSFRKMFNQISFLKEFFLSSSNLNIVHRYHSNSFLCQTRIFLDFYYYLDLYLFNYLRLMKSMLLEWSYDSMVPYNAR